MIKPLDLALQGGGSHGAFTWGVLERLLEDERIAIEGLCGTSAGAMNATILAYGLQTGGRQGAIQLLEKFWKAISDRQLFALIQPSLLDRAIGNGSLHTSFSYWMFESVTRIFSPYQLNPLDINPLRDVLLEMVDFDRLRSCKATKLFICATNVKNSRAKVFHLPEITADAVLASACLPFIFKAVEIDGEFYWDGGYMGNPPIFPLIDHTDSDDILLVQINPIEIDHVPVTAEEIRDRINELSFNASLMHEMRRVNFVRKVMERGMDMDGRVRPINIHHINPQKLMSGLGVSSKLNADWNFLNRLRTYGRQMADKWLAENYDKIGVESTCNIQQTFL
jgi:NTE family protein